jgi:outer membrane protein assembly factor BamB
MKRIRDEVGHTPGVVAVAPFVMTQGLISAGHDYAEGVIVVGVDADTGTQLWKVSTLGAGEVPSDSLFHALAPALYSKA